MALYCELENIITESDVEQKFIYPFLKAETPIGLGLKDSEILTKHILRKKLIDKGQKQMSYWLMVILRLGYTHKRSMRLFRTK